MSRKSATTASRRRRSAPAPTSSSRSSPGVELVLEAFERYWRKKPAVKRLVFKVIPDESTRLAALKAGEIDIAYSVRGELAEKLRQHTRPRAQAGRGARAVLPLLPRPVGRQIAVARRAGAKSRQPGDRPQEHQRGAHPGLLGRDTETRSSPKASISTGSRRRRNSIPTRRSGFWPRRASASGFDAGNYNCDASYANIGETVVDNLLAVGIRCSCGPSSAPPSSRNSAKRSTRTSSRPARGAFGNAATRIEAHLVKGGVFSYGSYPDIDALYQQQAGELDRSRREAILFKIQQLMVERTIYAPIWQLAFINGSDRASASRALAGSRCSPTRRPTRTSRSRARNRGSASQAVHPPKTGAALREAACQALKKSRRAARNGLRRPMYSCGRLPSPEAEAQSSHQTQG